MNYLAIALIVFGVFGALWLAVDWYMTYRSKPFDDRLLTAFHNSKAVLIGELTKLGGIAMALIVGAADMLNVPSVNQALQGLFTPQTVPFEVFAVAALLAFAAKLQAKKDGS